MCVTLKLLFIHKVMHEQHIYSNKMYVFNPQHTSEGYGINHSVCASKDLPTLAFLDYHAPNLFIKHS